MPVFVIAHASCAHVPLVTQWLLMIPGLFVHFFSEIQPENDVSVMSRSLEVTDISYSSTSEDLGSRSLLFDDSSEQDEEGKNC